MDPRPGRAYTAEAATDGRGGTMEVLKVIRRRTGLSLWHGKVLLGRLPTTLLEDVTLDLAEATVSQLREAGAAAEVRHGGHPSPS